MNLYENPEFQTFSGGTMRPGGVELTQEMLSIANFLPKERVLDVGCGLGTTMHLMTQQGLFPAGADTSDDLLHKARKACPNADLRKANAEALPWDDGVFQGVLCECSFSLIQNQRRALASFARVLAPGGKLLISDFYRQQANGGAYPAGTCLSGAQTADAQKNLVAQAGFRLVHWQDATAHLRQFTARMVWEFGSADAFWQALMPGGCGGANACQRPRLGYAWGLWVREALYE